MNLQFLYFNCALIIILLSFFNISQAETDIKFVTKSECISAINYITMQKAKDDVLLKAKRAATSEIFGEYIKSNVKVENSILTSDTIISSSIGFIRVQGSPFYYQGKNLGDICVKIKAFAKKEDFNKFLPKSIAKKTCIAEGDIKTIKKRAKEQAIIDALTDYNHSLSKLSKENLLPLMHEVKFSEEGFYGNNSVFCLKVQGMIYPIEIKSLIPHEAKDILNEQNLIYYEDFNSYQKGNLPPNWLGGKNMTITKNERSSILSRKPNTKQVAAITTNTIQFPDNYLINICMDHKKCSNSNSHEQIVSVYLEKFELEFNSTEILKIYYNNKLLTEIESDFYKDFKVYNLGIKKELKKIVFFINNVNYFTHAIELDYKVSNISFSGENCYNIYYIKVFSL